MLSDYSTKLTLVRISHGNRVYIGVEQCHMINGKAVLPGNILTAILDKLKIQRGEGFLVG